MATTILVVDDEMYVRRSVARVLERAQYEVVIAEDARQALAYARQMPIHAAIVDYDLPESDGLQVLSQLRDLQPSCLRILMTGLQDPQLYIDAVNRGEVLRVIRKPADGAGLLRTVRDAFEAAERMARIATAQRAAVAGQELAMLQECLGSDLLRLAVQPIVSAQGNDSVEAYEVLLRSQHPQLEGALAVLRIAERHGQLMDVGAKVFKLASAWLERLPTDKGLFINVSAEQLGDPGRLMSDISILYDQADRITLEITEQTKFSSIAGWEDSVIRLRRAGFRLAVDDFGAGYNSLASLAQLQPQVVKLDMSLVRDVHLNPFGRRVVELVVNLASTLDARVVAEGVESADEATVLIEAGCHLLQGYHFGRPQLEL